MQRAALFRQDMIVSWRTLLISVPFDKAHRFQGRQAIGQHIGGDPFGRSKEFGESPLAVDEIAHDDERPAITDKIER